MENSERDKTSNRTKATPSHHLRESHTGVTNTKSMTGKGVLAGGLAGGWGSVRAG